MVVKLYRKIQLAYDLVFREKSYIVKTGFLLSRLKKLPIDADGEFIPWMNYPIVEFLKKRLNKEISMFEYGSGFSTMFYSKRVKEVISIEYDMKWYDSIKNRIKEYQNAKIHFKALNEGYENAVSEFSDGKPFDLILIDGRKRMECLYKSIPFLSKKGVIILDDSSREKYSKAFEIMKQEGFNEITFSGLKPRGLGNDSTTIFYRCGSNVLGI